MDNVIQFRDAIRVVYLGKVKETGTPLYVHEAWFGDSWAIVADYHNMADAVEAAWQEQHDHGTIIQFLLEETAPD